MSLHLLKEAVLARAADARARQELIEALPCTQIHKITLIDATVSQLAQNPREVTQQDYDTLLEKLK